MPIGGPRVAVGRSRAVYPDREVLKLVRLVEDDHEPQLTNGARVAPPDLAHFPNPPWKERPGPRKGLRRPGPSAAPLGESCVTDDRREYICGAAERILNFRLRLGHSRTVPKPSQRRAPADPVRAIVSPHEQRRTPRKDSGATAGAPSRRPFRDLPSRRQFRGIPGHRVERCDDKRRPRTACARAGVTSTLLEANRRQPSISPGVSGPRAPPCIAPARGP